MNCKGCNDRARPERVFCSKECYRSWLKTNSKFAVSGSKSVNWKGGHHIDEHGYVKIYTQKSDGSYGYRREHVVQMELAIGRVLAPHECVHHIDRNKSNNEFANLKLMTKSEHGKLHVNAKSLKNLDHRQGEESGNAKLRESDVHWIKTMFNRGWSRYELADIFGISRTHTTAIISGKYWGWVVGDTI